MVNKEKDAIKINIEQVRPWFLENKHTLKKQMAFNSYVAPEPLHEIQVDLFEYNYKQPPRLQVKQNRKEGELNIRDLRALTTLPPYGIIAVDSFTKDRIGEKQWTRS